MFREQRDAVVGLAYMLCGDVHEAEDVAAEVFARTLPRFERGTVVDVGAYLRRAVVNEVRSRQRRLPLLLRERGRQTGDHRGGLGTAEQIAERDRALQLLSRLPSRQRTALVLRYWADLPDADAAEAMRCPVGTYRSLVSRGLAQLRVRERKGSEGR